MITKNTKKLLAAANLTLLSTNTVRSIVRPMTLALLIIGATCTSRVHAFAPDFSYLTILHHYYGYANLYEASFVGAYLQDVSFVDADLVDTLFDRAQLKRVDCYHADMRGTSMRLTSLVDVDFTDALLMDATFQGATLQRVSFIGADLSYADFRNTILHDVNFADTILHHADFRGARYDNTVVFPPYFRP